MGYASSQAGSPLRPSGASYQDRKEDSPVPLGPSASALAFDRGPQNFGIGCYDTVVQALVEL